MGQVCPTCTAAAKAGDVGEPKVKAPLCFPAFADDIGEPNHNARLAVPTLIYDVHRRTQTQRAPFLPSQLLSFFWCSDLCLDPSVDVSRLATRVRNDAGALSGRRDGDGDDDESGCGGGGGRRATPLFRFEKRHYRVLETLALPGAEDAPVRCTHHTRFRQICANLFWKFDMHVQIVPACWTFLSCRSAFVFCC